MDMIFDFPVFWPKVLLFFVRRCALYAINAMRRTALAQGLLRSFRKCKKFRFVDPDDCEKSQKIKKKSTGEGRSWSKRMTIFEMDAMDSGNDDENAPSTAGQLLMCVRLFSRCVQSPVVVAFCMRAALSECALIAATDDEKLISDERLNELANEEYKSCIVPFVSQRGKHSSKDHPPDR